MVVACSYKILWPKIDFLIFFPHFPLSTGHFFQHGGQARKMQKKSFFFAEMAFTHVGTKYIKRQQDFDNFLKFRHTLILIDIWVVFLIPIECGRNFSTHRRLRPNLFLIDTASDSQPDRRKLIIVLISITVFFVQPSKKEWQHFKPPRIGHGMRFTNLFFWG